MLKFIFQLIGVIIWNNFSPVPGFEGVAGSLEQVPLHHHPVGGVHVEFHLGVVVGEILGRGKRPRMAAARGSGGRGLIKQEKETNRPKSQSSGQDSWDQGADPGGNSPAGGSAGPGSNAGRRGGKRK